jgi:hypothetical protein
MNSAMAHGVVQSVSRIARRAVECSRERLRRLGAWLDADWRGARYAPLALLLVLVTAGVTLGYYANRPLVEVDPDTAAYARAARHVAYSPLWVDAARLPGYPLLMAMTFALAGQGNLGAVSVAQAILFALTTIEIYIMACLILRNSILALAVSLPVGASTHLLSFVKPILSEGLALFLVTTLALAVALYLRSQRSAALWVAAGCLAALFLTRPEWIYLPVPLFAYLLVIAWRRGRLRALLPHALAACLALYAVLGLYVALNAYQNGCACVTYVQNLNMLGKVMQYRMQGEAPLQYAELTRLVDAQLARGDSDPWNVVRSGYPPLLRDHYALAGEYSTAIITRRPGEYLAKSVPVARQVLVSATPFLPIASSGPSAPWLLPLDDFSQLVVGSLIAFPFAALFWWLLLVRSAGRSYTIEAMGALALVGFYGLAVTALGAYVYYARLHTPYAPLLILVIWGTVAIGIAKALQYAVSYWRAQAGASGRSA